MEQARLEIKDPRPRAGKPGVDMPLKIKDRQRKASSKKSVLSGRAKRSSARRLGRVYWVDSDKSLVQAYRAAKRSDILIAERGQLPLIKLARLGLRSTELNRAPHLIVTDRIAITTRAASQAFFDEVLDRGNVNLLPKSELREVLSAPHRNDLFIATAYLPEADALVLYRGTLGRLVVPLSWFRSREEGPQPDPGRAATTDYGQTIRLGDYEVAGDAVLYEFDPEYRRRAKERMRRHDPSLGGSIRRLRLQKGLSQSDFPDVPPRTIGRIERGEVQNPRVDTLEQIASILEVDVDELRSF